MEVMEAVDLFEINPGYDSQHLHHNSCLLCEHLRDGNQPVAFFPGEFAVFGLKASRIKVTIGPMDLKQFGQVRYYLAILHLHHDGPQWRANADVGVIYLEDPLNEEILAYLREKLGCRVS